MGNCTSFCYTKEDVQKNMINLEQIEQAIQKNEGIREKKSHRKNSYTSQSDKKDQSNNTYLYAEGSELISTTIGVLTRKQLPPITLENGGVYLGEWKNGYRDGHGVQTWPDGSRYEGNWINDKVIIEIPKN